MKLLVVSHDCATPTNQQFYSVVERVSDVDITLVSPSMWVDDYGNQRSLERWPAFRGRLEAIPVWMNGSVPLHVYRTTFRHILKRDKPDVIYVRHEPYGAATAQVYQANRLWHDCPIGFFTWQNIQKTYPPPFAQTERMVLRESAFAFAGSDSATEILRAKGYDGPCVLLPGSVDQSAYYPRESNDELKANLNVGSDEIVIGFMGRVSQVKGLDTALDALSSMRDIPWRFVVVGNGDYAEVLRSRAESLGIGDRLRFTGYVPHEEAPDYLSLFDVLVLPSETQANWKEQFGRVLIEALACGTALIGSDSGEIPHVIRRSGGGISFEEGNSTALSNALRFMAQHPDKRRRFAETGRQHVLRTHTDEVLANRFVSTLHRVLATEAPDSGSPGHSTTSSKSSSAETA
ncbi:glycosyl transferase family 1 [Longibacter salinarum]|uniref:Glycosyl transferase family 1 n=1 Tax=Longibacter salinarum TaxID=1850348 RepID=A0A2A8CW48_9BACT|nr:glycosyltransferase family 4 protein [Longibacter salinarum]PEN12814.1 glycosyl transferase family 1 [Longibacter salinarum]